MQKKEKLYPLVGVGGVIWDGDCVLLIKRGKPPMEGGWSLPGGRQELGEELEDAVIREIIEETGIIPGLGGLIDTADFIERDENGEIKFHYSLIDYWGEVIGGELKAGSDAKEVRWVHYKNLEDFKLWSVTTSMIEKAAKLRGRPRKHTISGHLKTAAIAALFGFGAYGILKLLKWGLNSLGLGI